MSVFVITDEQRAAVAAATDPVIIGTRETLLSQYAVGSAAEANLAKVAEAKAAAGKALDESDLPEAIAYRDLVAKAEAFRESVAAKAKAAADKVMAEYADKLTAGKTAVSEQRSKALAKLSDNAAEAIDTTADAAVFTGAIAVVEGLAKLYADRGIDLGFRKVSADKVINGKGTRVGAKGETGIRRVRWSSLTVNGEPVKTLSEAAKVIGLSAKDAADGFLLKRFTKDSGDLVAGQEYTTSVEHAGKTFTLVGTPKPTGDDAAE